MPYLSRLSSFFAILTFTAFASVASLNAADDKDDLLKTHSVDIMSTLDQAKQKALFYVPSKARVKDGQPVPLLVALHSWSGDYKQGLDYLPHAQQRKWVLIVPDFRGRNDRPEACASPLAIQDVMDAVAYARQHAHIDDERIYVMGGSGGGHMTLMMSTHAPQVWAATSAWVPISDLSAWYAETNGTKNTRYATMMETVCGGPPNAMTDAQYRARSPLFYLDKAKGLSMDINTGIHDGHTGSVPVSQALHAFNKLAVVNGFPEQQLPLAAITHMVQSQKIPEPLASERVDDPERRKTVLFRRLAGPVRITVFEGGHEFYIPAALDWLGRQTRGKAVNFQLGTGAVPKAGATEVPP